MQDHYSSRQSTLIGNGILTYRIYSKRFKTFWSSIK